MDRLNVFPHPGVFGWFAWISLTYSFKAGLMLFFGQVLSRFKLSWSRAMLTRVLSDCVIEMGFRLCVSHMLRYVIYLT